PGEPQDRQRQYGEADGFVAREHAELFQRRQVVRERGEGELHDDQHDDGPVQQLGDRTPAVRGISYDHGAKLMRVSASCILRLPGAVLPALLLSACPLPPHAPAGPVAAREGTRRNMLGEALLAGERNPQIVLRALRLEPAPSAAGDAGAAGGAGTSGAAGGTGTVLARVQTTVRGELRAITVPVSYRLAAGSVTASGEAPVRQSDLGLTPFSALLGA